MGRVSQSIRCGGCCYKRSPGGFLRGIFCSFGGVLFRRKAEITIIPVGDAASGPVPGQASCAPALGRLHEEWQNSMAVPTRDQRAAGPVPLFAQVDTTSPGCVAKRSSAVWEFRHGTSVPLDLFLSLPRWTQLALVVLLSAVAAQCLGSHSSLCPVAPNRLGSVAKRGSAVWESRHATRV